MPGLPFHDLSDADALTLDPPQADALALDPPQAPLPSRASPTLSKELERMPLHHIVAINHINGTSVALPEDLNSNQGSAGLALANNKEFSSKAGPTDHFASQFASGIHGSADSEHDLAAMVHDFMENGSYGSDFPESSDGENGLPNGSKCLETLQALKFNATPLEKELLSILTKLSLSIKEIDLVCLKPSVECKGGCIRRLLVKHLRLSGYDAAICSSKWPNSGKVPGGEYEYIDVTFEGDQDEADRLIVDVDFQSQFEIARPTHSYAAALKLLPVIFAGSTEKLGQVLQVMAEAAKLSLRQNSMPLPPWRTLDYMNAKWMSSFERRLIDTKGGICRGPGNSQWRERTRTKQCVEQLRHLKLCIAAETDKNHIAKPTLDRNRGIYFAKTRRLSTGSPYHEKNHFMKASVFEKPE